MVTLSQDYTPNYLKSAGYGYVLSKSKWTWLSKELLRIIIAQGAGKLTCQLKLEIGK